MKTRKTHRKSRYGCETCKKRHIKCDEKRPECDKCRLAVRPCSYPGMEPRTPSQNLSSPRDDRTICPPAEWKQCTGFSLLDISLVHLFSTSTCRTLSTQRSLQNVWGMTIVQISFTNTFLLHGILSIAALHRAFTDSSADTEDLINYAIEHQSIALNSFQQALTKPDREQADALFAFSILTFTYTMAMARETPDTASQAAKDSNTIYYSNILDFGWIRMARGIRMVVFAHMDWIKEGCLKVLLQERNVIMGQDCAEQDIPAPWWDADHLAQLWRANNSNDNNQGLLEGEAAAYEETLSHLEYLHRTVRFQLDRRTQTQSQAAKDKDKDGPGGSPAGQQPTFAAIFRWLIDIPETFIEFVEQHRPVALILLAHYATLSARIRHMWWSEQSGQVIIKRVRDFLDPKWHVWMQSPLQHL